MYHRGIQRFRHAFIFLIIIKVSEKVLSKEVQKRFQVPPCLILTKETLQDSFEHSNIMGQL